MEVRVLSPALSPELYHSAWHRLTCDLVLQETLMASMCKADVEVFSVTEPDIDSDDATRVLVRQVLGSIAQRARPDSVENGRGQGSQRDRWLLRWASAVRMAY